MSLNIILEDMPQLVLLKITTFLSHKELLAMEQVSNKLKCIVDAHFSTTDRLIIGSLPEIAIQDGQEEYQVIPKDKDSLNGLLKVITRCGTRLRTIQINVTDRFHFDPVYIMYFNHILGSTKVSVKCPNVESVITSPKMITFETASLFNQQKVALSRDTTKIYASQIPANDTCKLRSISLYFKGTSEEREFERILFLYPNLEQIALSGNHKRFLKYLPEFIENGLKDLYIVDAVSIENGEKLCNIGMNLQSLNFTVEVKSASDIAFLNKIQLSRHVKLKLEVWEDDCFALINDNVCNAVNSCAVFGSPSDYNLMTRLKNLEEFEINDSGELKAIAEKSFPKLQRIQNPMFLCSCDTSSMCELKTFLPQLLINKGDQLTLIKILHVCCPLDVVWLALKHCTAAMSIEFSHVDVDSMTTLSYEDVTAILNLPNLQKFSFSTLMEGDDLCDLLRELIERALKEHTHFKFEYKEVKINGSCYIVRQEFTLKRIVVL